MNKAQLQSLWDHQRKILNNARKQVDLVPEDKLDFRPTPEVRTIRELAAHMFSFITMATEMVATGKYVEKPLPAPATKAELLTWIDKQIADGYAEFAKLTDAQLAATLEVWGMKFPAWTMASGVFEELVHHRGQFTLCLRLIGIAPVNIYDYWAA